MIKQTAHCCLLLLLLVITGCAAPAVPVTPAATAVSTPAPTDLPPTPSPVPSTATPAPTPTLVLFQPPAARFLPDEEDLGGDYSLNQNILLTNLALLAQLPVPKENLAAASFGFTAQKYEGAGPQDNVYFSQVFAVIIASDEATARFFFEASQSSAYRAQAFLMILPSAIYQSNPTIETIPVGESICDQAAISAVNFDVFANYRLGTPIPTRDPTIEKYYPGFNANQIAHMPPEIDLYAVCRIKNALVLYWGSAPNNYDGNLAPIPDQVIAAQVEERLRIVAGKLE